MIYKTGLLLIGVLAGSTVSCRPTIYHKEVTVEKNAQGAIEKITVVEEITQHRSELPHEHKYLDQ